MSGLFRLRDMPRFPALVYRPVVKKLKKIGFSFDRMAKGSHELWYNPKTGQRTTVPHHEGKVIKRKTLKNIIKATGLTPEEFGNL